VQIDDDGGCGCTSTKTSAVSLLQSAIMVISEFGEDLCFCLDRFGINIDDTVITASVRQQYIFHDF